MKIAVIKETFRGETRVALIPANVAKLTQQGLSVIVEQGAGVAAGFTDQHYQEAGASIGQNQREVVNDADIVLTVHAKGQALTRLLAHMSSGQTLIGMMDPLASPGGVLRLSEHGINGVALELVPRITRAQSMDVLSSNGTISGYKGVLMGASAASQMFPMLMTAAGTLKPARVFVMGVGVAGLQACSTAKRLGGVVEAYDIRPAAREQILSVGARPVELNIEAEDTEGSGGYAKEQSEQFIAKQQEAMADVLAQQDVVITTAAIPGKRAPILITEGQLNRMKPGSVIVDLAAETGGNCALSEPGKTIIHNGITIIAPLNLPASVPNHASQMFGTNLTNLVLLKAQGGEINWDFNDEIIRETCVSFQGEIRHPRIRDLLSLPPLVEKQESPDAVAVTAEAN